MKKVLATLLFFILFSLGISLQLKADIGQSVFNAFCLSMATYFDLKVGAMINICNLIIFCIYIMVKKGMNLHDLLQFVYIVLNGLLVDLILDHFLFLWHIESYMVKVIIFLLGLFIAAFSLGQILKLGIVKFPLENLCLELTKKTTLNFGNMRYIFDFIFILGVVSIFILNHDIMTIREGTVISFIMLSYLINLSYKFSIKKTDANV